MISTSCEINSLDDLPFAFKFQALRKAFGMTAERFANESGLSVDRVRYLERPGSEPDITELQIICRTLGIKPSVLIKL